MDRDSPPQFLAAIGSQLALAFSMLVLLYMRIFNDISARYSQEGARQIMNFDSPSQIVGVTIIFAFISLIMLAGMTSYEAVVENAKAKLNQVARRLSVVRQSLRRLSRPPIAASEQVAKANMEAASAATRAATEHAQLRPSSVPQSVSSAVGTPVAASEVTQGVSEQEKTSEGLGYGERPVGRTIV